MTNNLIAVTLLIIIPKCYTLYSGDDCEIEGERAVCTVLKECKPLMDEIMMQGLSRELKFRLKRLSCGFEGNEPLVCCRRLPNDIGGISSDQPSFDTNHRPQQTFSTNNPNWNSQGNDRTERPNTNHGGFNNHGDSNSWNNMNNGNIQDNTDRFNTNDKPARPFDNAGDGAQTATVVSGTEKSNPPDISRHRNLRLLPDRCGIIESDRIVGGNRTSLYEMPWMVLLSYETIRGLELSCGGSLITKWYVLTAAHCVSFLGSKKLAGVVIGDHDTSTDPDCEREEGVLDCAPNARNMTINKVIAHPGYSPQNLYDDIALIKLSEPADLSQSNIGLLCLPATRELQNDDLVGDNGVVAGWGTTEDGLRSPVLLKIKLPIVSRDECQEFFKERPKIYKSQLCAGGLQHKDSCGGDSGGPLMYPGQYMARSTAYVQRGIVSFGSKKCGVEGYPGIYTRVAYYMDWILDHIDG